MIDYFQSWKGLYVLCIILDAKTFDILTQNKLNDFSGSRLLTTILSWDEACRCVGGHIVKNCIWKQTVFASL